MKKIFNNPWIIGVGTLLIGTGILYFVFGIGKTVPMIENNTSTRMKVTGSPNSINTVGQVGNNTIVASSDRTLSSDQIDLLKHVLSQSTGKVALKSKLFDSEAKNYANQLAEVFRLAGWQVGPNSHDLLDDFLNDEINIFMTGSDSTSSVIIYPVLRISAFDQAKIRYRSEQPRTGSFGGNLQEDTLYLEIGSKE